MLIKAYTMLISRTDTKQWGKKAPHLLTENDIIQIILSFLITDIKSLGALRLTAKVWRDGIPFPPRPGLNVFLAPGQVSALSSLIQATRVRTHQEAVAVIADPAAISALATSPRLVANVVNQLYQADIEAAAQAGYTTPLLRQQLQQRGAQINGWRLTRPSGNRKQCCGLIMAGIFFAIGGVGISTSSDPVGAVIALAVGVAFLALVASCIRADLLLNRNLGRVGLQPQPPEPLIFDNP